MLRALEAAGKDDLKRADIYAFYTALSQMNIDHHGQRFEAIEEELLKQLHHDIADTTVPNDSDP